MVILIGGDDQTSALVNRGKHASLELVGSNDFNFHDRLEDHRLCFFKRLAECTESSGLERLVGGVYRVVCSVVDHSPNSNDWEAHLGALLQRKLEALITGWDVFGGNRSTFNLINKLVVDLFFFITCSYKRLDISSNLCILTGTTGLLLVSVVEVRSLGNRFAVGNLRLSHFDESFVLTLHPFDIHLKVQLAHPLDDRLVGLGIDVGAERWVFFGEAV